jgi:Condensation domain
MWPGDEGPLSFQQEQLWFLRQLAPESAAYNFSAAFQIDGDLDPDVLERSLREVATRHTILRTAFSSHRGVGTQRVLPEPTMAFRAESVASLPPSRRAVELGRLVAANADQPFDLAHGETMRALLLRTDPERHLLLITFHHIVGDAASVRILLGELAASYRELQGSAALAPEPPKPRAQYIDYARWQRQQMTGKRLAPELEFWKGYLRGAPESLDLPRDRPATTAPSGRGATHELELPPEICDGLRALARAHRTTLFTVLLAAFQALLFRYSGQEDVVVGVPVSDRRRAEYEQLIGFFVKTVAIRCDLSGDPTFGELLGRVQPAVLDALDHADTPFEKIVEAVRPPRRENHNPIFQVMFSFDERSPADAAEPAGLAGLAWPDGLRVTGVPAPRTGAMFPLTLNLTAGPAGLTGNLEYSTDVFVPNRIAYVASHLRTLLTSLAS